MYTQFEAATPMMLDEWSGRYFSATMLDVERAVFDINKLLVEEGAVVLNDLYDRLGLSPLPMGETSGWTSEFSGEVRVTFGAIIMPNNWPALTMEFRQPPQPGVAR